MCQIKKGGTTSTSGLLDDIFFPTPLLFCTPHKFSSGYISTTNKAGSIFSCGNCCSIPYLSTCKLPNILPYMKSITAPL